jgi:hypothetical protein
MKKFKKLSVKNVAVICLILTLGVCAAVIAAGIYNRPCADDFSYGWKVHSVVIGENVSLRGVINAAFDMVKNNYNVWQGTYSSIFVMSLTPSAWGTQFYFLTPVILLSTLIFGVFFLFTSAVRFIGLKASGDCRSAVCICSCAVITAYIAYMPSIVEGLYWWNGSVFYTFSHSIFFVYTGMLLRLFCGGGKKLPNLTLVVSSLVLAVAIGGVNYPTALISTVLTGGILIYSFFARKRNCLKFVIMSAFVFQLIAFMINVRAPGNAVRQAQLTKINPVTAVLLSVVRAIVDIDNWSKIVIIITLVLLVPLFVKLAKESNLSFKYPHLVALVSLGLFAAMNTPIYYSTGNAAGPGRYRNIVYLTYLLLAIVNTFYISGWLVSEKGKRHLNIEELGPAFKKIKLYVVAALIVFIVTSCRTNNLGGLVSDFLKGRMSTYADEYDMRLKILEDQNVNDAVFYEFSQKPKTIFFDDAKEDSEHWENRAISRYYGKDSVTVLPRLGK